MADLKRHKGLVVITKTYDFILWSCNHTGKFPRNHRFVLGERVERTLYDLLETLIRPNYTKPRQELLEQANLVLEILRFQMRLAKDLQCLKVDSFGSRSVPRHKVQTIVRRRFARVRIRAEGNASPAGLVGRKARRPWRVAVHGPMVTNVQ
jgi:hypothetical protein